MEALIHEGLSVNPNPKVKFGLRAGCDRDPRRRPLPALLIDQVSTPGHSAWRAVLGEAQCLIMQELDGLSDPKYSPKKGKQAVLCMTGPILLSRVVYPMSPQYPHLILKNSAEFGFAYDFWANPAKRSLQP